MKSYNHLFEKLVDTGNLKQAIANSARGKNKNRYRHRKLKEISRDPDSYIEEVRSKIERFEPPKHIEKVINDGINAKKRKITVPTVYEEIIHHAVVNVFKEITLPSMYEHSYASIQGRGTHLAARRIKRWIKSDKKNTKYCLKLDIRKYFESINQDILLQKLRKLIRDNKFYSILEKIVRSTDSGIPLGFVTSQWFANFYLTELDHKIKEEWQARYYVRFMDDMIIFGSNKRKLHRLFDNLKTYLENELDLEVKDNWQIFRLDSRPLDFLGFRFYRNHTGLRRKLALKMCRKADRIAKKPQITVHDARQMVTYAGYTKYADVYDWYQDHIKPCVNIRRLRKQISYHDRRKNNERNRRIDISAQC